MASADVDGSLIARLYGCEENTEWPLLTACALIVLYALVAFCF